MKDKIKALFFISSLAGGGAERVMVNILSHIDRGRIDPSLILLYPFDDSPYRQYLPGELKVIVVGRRSDSVIGKVRQFINFFSAVRREKPQVIFSMLTHNNIMALFAKILFRIRVIVCEHITFGEVLKTKEGKRILGLPAALLVRILYRFADRIVVVSEGIKANLIEEFHIPGRRIQVIYNPIDLDCIIGLSSMQPEHPFLEGGAPIVVAAGRLVAQKRFDILIEAFGMILSEMDARLIILGEGPEEEPLKKLAGDRGILGKVSFAGFQKNLYSFLSKAAVFVLSSNYEGLPMVMLEAMACGAPVISSDCRSGPREILENGRCGLLVPPDDAGALSREMTRLLNDGTLRGHFSRMGKERAEDFSIEKIIKQYERVICDLDN